MRFLSAMCLIGALAVAAAAVEPAARPTPAKLGEMLTDLGYEPNDASAKKTKDLWSVPVEIDGTNLNVEISLSADGTTLQFAVRLASADDSGDATWLKLLTENSRITPALFSCNAAAKSINLRMAVDARGLTPVRLKRSVDDFEGFIRRTAPVWSAAPAK